MPKSSKPPAVVQHETHTEYNRGAWVHPDLRTARSEGKITDSEIMVMLDIDCLVDSKSGRGCFASNRYLAKQAHKTDRQVRRIITKLMKLGYVFQVPDPEGKGRRVLETVYSRLRLLQNEPMEPAPRGEDKNVRGGRTKMSAYKLPPTGVITNGSNLRTVGSSNGRCAPVSGSRQSGDDSMGLIPGLEDSPKAKRGAPQKEDFARAEKLREIVQRFWRKAVKGTRKKWANEFRLLREEVQDGARVDQILEWYSVHARDNEYVPVAQCAETFRTKFLKLEAAVERESRRNPVVTVSLEAKESAARVKMMGWRGAGAGDLEKAVQFIIDEREKYLWAVGSAWEAAGRPRKTILGFAADSIHPAPYFAERWLADVNRKIKSFQNWDGDLIRHCYRHDRDALPWFRKEAGRHGYHPDEVTEFWQEVFGEG